MRRIKLFENFNKIESVIIVGGGISSLYTAYLIKKNHPNTKFTIIEKDSECGGRVKMSSISGVNIPTGAHFIKWENDFLVRSLLNEFKIDLKPYELEIDYTFNEGNFEYFVQKLKRESQNFDRSELTFKEFATSVLGLNDYNEFVKMMGYTDYLNYDFIDAIDNYGLRDNVPGYLVADVNWKELVEKMVSFIGEQNIIYNTEIKSIRKDGERFILNSKYSCEGIVIGVTVNEIKKLLDNEIYDGIGSQKFIKVFSRVKNFTDVENYNIIDSSIRKVIRVKDDVWTIAFADNEDAEELKLKNSDYFQKELQYNFENPNISISDLKKFYWKEGTHYYKPLSSNINSREDFIRMAQNPGDRVWVIGEMVAEKQGWVEGALSSVLKIDIFKYL